MVICLLPVIATARPQEAQVTRGSTSSSHTSCPVTMDCKEKYPASVLSGGTGLLGTSCHGSDKTSYLAAEGCLSKVLGYLASFHDACSSQQKRTAPTEQPRRTGSQASGRKRGVSGLLRPVQNHKRCPRGTAIRKPSFCPGLPLSDC